MITLKADNRALTKNAKYSYLADNYLSGVSEIVVINATSFAANDYILLGEFGSETSEILQISDVSSESPSNSPSNSPSQSTSKSPSSSESPSNSPSFSPSNSPSISPSASVSPSAEAVVERDPNALTLVSVTRFAHPQDTKVTIIRYNKVRFLHTDTPIPPTDTSPAISGYIDVQADDFYTVYQDNVNSTGFGWFLFYNYTTMKATVASNPIPYTGFEESSVKKIFDAFFSLLNNKELRLITNEDAFRWLNEAYSIAKNELNLVNVEFTVPAEITIATTAGISEYQLPANFSNLISVSDESGEAINYVEIKDTRRADKMSFFSKVGYYIRSNYIGFVPVPKGDVSFYIYYASKTTTLTSYYDNIDLPDNNYFPLLDHMLYRAAIKVGRPNAADYQAEFDKGIQRMKVVSIKQSASKDSWSIDAQSNV